jgi:hypothetical protein
MNANMPEIINVERRRQEIEFTLTAVVNAISAGKLPPDDACAWARIAAGEAKALGASSEGDLRRELQLASGERGADRAERAAGAVAVRGAEVGLVQDVEALGADFDERAAA